MVKLENHKVYGILKLLPLTLPVCFINKPRCIVEFCEMLSRTILKKKQINISATVTRKDHIPDYAQISGAPVLPLPDYER